MADVSYSRWVRKRMYFDISITHNTLHHGGQSRGRRGEETSFILTPAQLHSINIIETDTRFWRLLLMTGKKSFNGKEHYRVILCFYITREIIVLLIISITPTSLQSNSRYSQRRPNRPTLTSPLTTQYQGSSTHLPEQQLSAPPVQININTIWSWGRVRRRYCRYCRYCRYGDTSR